MYSSTLGGQFDIKSADELVASSRLNIIEREHKSFGSLIDHRQLFALEDTPKPYKKVAASTNDTAALSNFWKSATQDQGQSPTNKIPEANVKNNTSAISHSYANEELIWRTKASVATYFQKRAYEDPTLQTFKDNLTADQKKRYKDLTLKALQKVADKYRSEMGKIKDEMDIDGVFHPAANAHRVHCMYLMKIYKGINASAIEDPVLRRLRAETATKKEAEEAEEDRKHLLIRIATIGREDAVKETSTRRSSLESLGLQGGVPIPVAEALNNASVSPNGRKREKGDKGEKGEKGGDKEKDRRMSQASTAPQISPVKNRSRVSISDTSLPSYSADRKLSNTGLSTAAVMGTPFMTPIGTLTPFGTLGTPFMTPSGTPFRVRKEGEDEEEETSSASPSISQLSKWNHDNSDPSLNGFSSAANGGAIPHVDKMMFNRMRQRRLGAVDARSLLPDEANKLENAYVTNPKKQKQRSSLINNESTAWMLEKLQFNAGTRPPPDRDGKHAAIVPFEEFHKMFQEYSNGVVKDKAERAEKLKISQSCISPRKHVTNATTQESQSTKENREKSENRRNSLTTSEKLLSEKGRIALMDPGPGDDEILELDPESTMSAVQFLAKEDPLFDTFLKMSLRDKPAGRRLTKVSAAGLMEPKVKRVTAPLGLSAVLLDPLHTLPPPSQTLPPTFYDNNSGSVLPNSLASSSLLTNHIFNIEAARAGGKLHNYMVPTRQGLPEDRHQKGPRAAGFANCFQSQEMIELSLSLLQPSQSEVFNNTLNTQSVNGFKERRTAHPGPELDGSKIEINEPLNLAVKRNNQSQGNLRSMAAQRRRQERERGREDEDSVLGEDKSARGKGTEETQASSMQRKLVQMWDCLQVPASERLDFMRKFSLYPYSMKLGVATDLWSEVAVLVMVRQEILKLIGIFKTGYRRMPLLASELIDSIYSAVPLDLASRSSVFLPLAAPSSAKSLTLSGRGRTSSIVDKNREKDKSDSESIKSKPRTPKTPKTNPVPLSAAVLTTMIDHISSRFHAFSASENLIKGGHPDHRRSPATTTKKQRKNSTGGLPSADFSRGFNSSMSPGTKKSRKASFSGVGMKSDDDDEDILPLEIKSEKEATQCLLQLRKTTDQLLLAALRRTLDEVSDVVTFGKMSVQEWMNISPDMGTAQPTPFMSRQQSMIGPSMAAFAGSKDSAV